MVTKFEENGSLTFEPGYSATRFGARILAEKEANDGWVSMPEMDVLRIYSAAEKRSRKGAKRLADKTRGGYR